MEFRMADAQQYVFTHKQLATILVKVQGLHEGLWIVQYSFGLAGANVGPNANELNPAAVVPILNISLGRAPEANALTVDAAEVNPAK
jgi:hypothetical protein